LKTEQYFLLVAVEKVVVQDVPAVKVMRWTKKL